MGLYEINFSEGALTNQFDFLIVGILNELMGTSRSKLLFLVGSAVSIFCFSIIRFRLEF